MNTNDVINLVLGIIGLVGTVFGFWSYFRNKQEKEPQFHYKTFRTIVKPSQEDKLKIIYNGLEVNKVSTTYIFFWNKGKEPLKNEDIPSPLIISFPYHEELTLLDYRVIKVSRCETDFKLVPCRENSFQFQFNFLDQDDGVAMEFKHTGDIDIKPKIEGTILTVPKGIKTHLIQATKLKRASSPERISILFLLLFLYFGIVTGVLVPSFNTLVQISMNFPLRFVFAVITLFTTIAFFLELHNLSQIQYPKSIDIHKNIPPFDES